MKKYHKVENVKIEKGILHLIVDGNSIQRELKDMSPLLAAAREEELKEFEVSPSGYGIHWPLIDEIKGQIKGQIDLLIIFSTFCIGSIKNYMSGALSVRHICQADKAFCSEGHSE